MSKLTLGGQSVSAVYAVWPAEKNNVLVNSQKCWDMQRNCLGAHCFNCWYANLGIKY